MYLTCKACDIELTEYDLDFDPSTEFCAECRASIDEIVDSLMMEKPNDES